MKTKQLKEKERINLKAEHFYTQKCLMIVFTVEFFFFFFFESLA